jgi:hypothetical protein
MLDNLTKELLERYIKWIEKEDWENFFERIQAEYIPQTVSKIARAFETAGIEPLSELSFIPEGYFLLSPIREYTTPSNIKRICYKSFYACDVEQVHITGNVYDVNQFAFEGCDFLESVIFDEGVKYIDDAVFYACEELTTVVLPKSLERLGHNVFNGCDKLTELTYNGTCEEWRKIRNHEFVNEGSYISKIICSDDIIML